MPASKELIEKGYASTMEEWWDLVDHYRNELAAIVERSERGLSAEFSLYLNGRDAIKLYKVLHRCWDQLPDNPSIHDIPGFGPLCDLCSDFPYGKVEKDPGQLDLGGES